MFSLNGKTLLVGKAFEHEGIQYPANWLSLTSLEEKQAIGIAEVSTPEPGAIVDYRFYTGPGVAKELEDVTDEDGNTRSGLKTFWKQEQDVIAAGLLAPSDWRVTKATELGTTVASVWLTYRGAVRSACNTRQSEITGASSVEALKELFFGDEQIQETDSDGNGVVDSDGNPVMVANPGRATAWPVPPA